MVFALAGDSTMTMLSAMTYRKCLILKQKTAGEPRTSFKRRAPVSVRRISRRFQHQSAEPLDCQLAFRLAREHHEHDPLQLLGVGLLGIEREQALDHDLALRRCQYTCPLECQQQPAALGGESHELAVGEHAYALRRRAGLRRRLAPRSKGEIGEPVERALDLGGREAHALEIACQVLAA